MVGFLLQQNYPNPFNPSTTIRFSVPERISSAKLDIYDVTGKIIWSQLLENVDVGTHEVVWNGKTQRGTSAASGAYVYKLTAGNFSSARQMVLLK